MNNYRPKSRRKDLDATGCSITILLGGENAHKGAIKRCHSELICHKAAPVVIPPKDERARGHVSPTSGVISHMVILTHNPKKHPL